MSNLPIIGHTAYINLPKYGILKVPAKTDTGADSSSIWASDIRESDDSLIFKLFSPESKFYTGEDIVISPSQFHTIRIINSFGHREERYRVRLSIVVQDRKIKATFTLANRANSTYPVLLGRRLLANKFLVDVTKRQVKLNQPSVTK